MVDVMGLLHAAVCEKPELVRRIIKATRVTTVPERATRR